MIKLMMMRNGSGFGLLECVISTGLLILIFWNTYTLLNTHRRHINHLRDQWLAHVQIDNAYEHMQWTCSSNWFNDVSQWKQATLALIPKADARITCTSTDCHVCIFLKQVVLSCADVLKDSSCWNACLP